MKPKKINLLLNDYFKETKFLEVKDSLIISRIWEEVVGKAIAKNTEIINIKHGIIVIKTKNPVWRNELNFEKENLLQKLKEKEPKLKIKKIEFR